MPHPNHLRLRLGGGHEGIELSLEAKLPGETMEPGAVPLAFSYEQALGAQAEAYERLLYDAIEDRQALFARQDGVEQCWRIVEPALESPGPLHPYAPGSWGPAAADELIRSAGDWHVPQRLIWSARTVSSGCSKTEGGIWRSNIRPRRELAAWATRGRTPTRDGLWAWSR